MKITLFTSVRLARPLCVLLFLCASIAAAQAQFEYVNSGGSITITKYTGSDSAVVIPATIFGLPVATIGNYAFSSNTNVTTVQIPDSVRTLGSEAFNNCTSLRTLALGTNLASIGLSAFAGCTNLTSIAIPDSVTNLGPSAFEACASLTNVTVSRSLANIRSFTFYDCASLSSVTLPPGLTTIGNFAFYRCGSLRDLALPGTLKSIGSTAFFSCTNLTNMPIPDTVTNIGDTAFYQCTGLTNLTLPAGLTVISDSAFADCDRLANVTLPGGVTNIGKFAFFSCNALTGMSIPAGVITIGESAFEDCTSLAEIVVDALNRFYSSVDGVLLNKAGTTLIYWPYGKVGAFTIAEGTTNIMARAFYARAHLTSVTIPSTVSSIGEEAFPYCSSLANITVAPLNAVYTSVDGVLFDKSLTTLLQYPGGKPGAYTVPGTVTNIADSAFAGAESLDSVVIPSSVTTLGYAVFYSCTRLTGVYIPESVSDIGDWAFGYCTNLISLEVNAANPAYRSVDGALFDKTQRTLIQFPGGRLGSYLVPEGVTNVGLSAFYGCRLTSVTIPGSVRSIAYLAFGSCPNLTGFYFRGDAPGLLSILYGPSTVVIYYLPGTSGWGPTIWGQPTALWVLPYPVILATISNFGVRSNQFGFTISWATNASVVVEASTDMGTPHWTALSTNSLSAGFSWFSDPDWAAYPQRVYRLRSL